MGLPSTTAVSMHESPGNSNRLLQVNETAQALGLKPTPRDKEIIGLMLDGLSNPEIAERLHISLRTVKAHFHLMYLRFGIQGGHKRVKLAVAFTQPLGRGVYLEP